MLQANKSVQHATSTVKTYCVSMLPSKGHIKYTIYCQQCLKNRSEYLIKLEMQQKFFLLF